MRVYINLVHDYNDICKYSIIFDFFPILTYFFGVFLKIISILFRLHYEGYINVCNP